MAAPVRYPSGVSTTTVKNSALWNLPEPDRAKIHAYFNDFSTYVAADWTETKVGTGATALVASEPYGAVASTCSAADNDGLQYQLTTANFTMAAGKKAWFKTRMKISDATQSDFVIGLCVIDTTLLGAVDGDGFTDGIYFAKEDGDTQVDFGVQKDTTTGQLRTTNISTLDTSYHTYGFYFDGSRFVEAYVDDVKKATLDLTTTLATYLPDTALTVSWGLLNGEAVAKVMTVDYLYAAIER